MAFIFFILTILSCYYFFFVELAKFCQEFLHKELGVLNKERVSKGKKEILSKCIDQVFPFEEQEIKSFLHFINLGEDLQIQFIFNPVWFDHFAFHDNFLVSMEQPEFYHVGRNGISDAEGTNRALDALKERNLILDTPEPPLCRFVYVLSYMQLCYCIQNAEAVFLAIAKNLKQEGQLAKTVLKFLNTYQTSLEKVGFFLNALSLIQYEPNQKVREEYCAAVAKKWNESKISLLKNTISQIATHPQHTSAFLDAIKGMLYVEWLYGSQTITAVQQRPYIRMQNGNEECFLYVSENPFEILTNFVKALKVLPREKLAEISRELGCSHIDFLKGFDELLLNLANSFEGNRRFETRTRPSFSRSEFYQALCQMNQIDKRLVETNALKYELRQAHEKLLSEQGTKSEIELISVLSKLLSCLKSLDAVSLQDCLDAFTKLDLLQFHKMRFLLNRWFRFVLSEVSEKNSEKDIPLNFQIYSLCILVYNSSSMFSAEIVKTSREISARLEKVFSEDFENIQLSNLAAQIKKADDPKTINDIYAIWRHSHFSPKTSFQPTTLLNRISTVYHLLCHMSGYEESSKQSKAEASLPRFPTEEPGKSDQEGQFSKLTVSANFNDKLARGLALLDRISIISRYVIQFLEQNREFLKTEKQEVKNFVYKIIDLIAVQANVEGNQEKLKIALELATRLLSFKNQSENKDDRFGLLAFYILRRMTDVWVEAHKQEVEEFLSHLMENHFNQTDPNARIQLLKDLLTNKQMLLFKQVWTRSRPLHWIEQSHIMGIYALLNQSSDDECLEILYSIVKRSKDKSDYHTYFVPDLDSCRNPRFFEMVEKDFAIRERSFVEKQKAESCSILGYTALFKYVLTITNLSKSQELISRYLNFLSVQLSFIHEVLLAPENEDERRTIYLSVFSAHENSNSTKEMHFLLQENSRYLDKIDSFVFHHLSASGKKNYLAALNDYLQQYVQRILSLTTPINPIALEGFSRLMLPALPLLQVHLPEDGARAAFHLIELICSYSPLDSVALQIINKMDELEIDQKCKGSNGQIVTISSKEKLTAVATRRIFIEERIFEIGLRSSADAFIKEGVRRLQIIKKYASHLDSFLFTNKLNVLVHIVYENVMRTVFMTGNQDLHESFLNFVETAVKLDLYKNAHNVFVQMIYGRVLRYILYPKIAKTLLDEGKLKNIDALEKDCQQYYLSLNQPNFKPSAALLSLLMKSYWTKMPMVERLKILNSALTWIRSVPQSELKMMDGDRKNFEPFSLCFIDLLKGFKKSPLIPRILAEDGSKKELLKFLHSVSILCNEFQDFQITQKMRNEFLEFLNSWSNEIVAKQKVANSTKKK